MCSCNTEIESNERFLLRCNFFSSQRSELFDSLNKNNSSFFKLGAKDKAVGWNINQKGAMVEGRTIHKHVKENS